MREMSRLYLCLQVGERLQSKSFLKAFSKIGWAAESGIKSCFRDIAILTAQQVKRLEQSIFAKQGIGRHACYRDALPVQLRLADRHDLTEICDTKTRIVPVVCQGFN